MIDRMWDETSRLMQDTTTSSSCRQPSCLQDGQVLISPRYEITDSDQAIQISLDVPGVAPEDMDVTVEDGNLLTITGQRTQSERFQNKFSQQFSLDPAVDVNQLSAQLTNGVLGVTAPKDMKQLEENIRKIPIQAGVDASVTIDSGSKSTDEMEAVAKEDPEIEASTDDNQDLKPSDVEEDVEDLDDSDKA